MFTGSISVRSPCCSLGSTTPGSCTTIHPRWILFAPGSYPGRLRSSSRPSQGHSSTTRHGPRAWESCYSPSCTRSAATADHRPQVCCQQGCRQAPSLSTSCPCADNCSFPQEVVCTYFGKYRLHCCPSMWCRTCPPSCSSRPTSTSSSRCSAKPSSSFLLLPSPSPCPVCTQTLLLK